MSKLLLSSHGKSILRTRKLTVRAEAARLNFIDIAILLILANYDPWRALPRVRQYRFQYCSNDFFRS